MISEALEMDRTLFKEAQQQQLLENVCFEKTSREGSADFPGVLDIACF